MQETLKQLLSELHSAYFKPNGFKKIRNKFSRECDGVRTEIEFQSSQWNTKGEPIRFYVNFGVCFLDLPPRPKDGHHGSGRLGGIVSEAPPHYELTKSGVSSIRDELIASFPRLFDSLPEHYDDVRKRAIHGWASVIPVPDTWKTD